MKLIEHYHSNLKDLVRRKYLVNRHSQPRDIDFPYLVFFRKALKYFHSFYYVLLESLIVPFYLVG